MAWSGIEGLALLVALVTTAAMLLLLVALLLRSRRLARGRSREREQEHTASRATPVPAVSEAGAVEASAAHPAPATPGHPAPDSDRHGTGFEATTAPASADGTAAGAAIAPAARAAGITRQIDRAAANGEKTSLAELHLELAEALLADGRPGPAAGELRKSIMAAARLRQHGTHATARLLLGDLAEKDGDLTTACEHWQIARSLFHDLRLAGQLASADARMRRIRCPTDWVLNDF